MNNIQICYLSNVPWRHIFQRPQIFPLFLEKDFDCVVIQKYWPSHLRMQKQSMYPKKMVSILQLPKSSSISFLNVLSELYTRRIIIHIINHSDVVWICHPSEFKYLPKDYAGKVIYDCMDYYVELGTLKKRQEAECYEAQLVDRADIVFASSIKLMEHICEPNKTILVRNGFFSSGDILPIKHPLLKQRYVLGYFGTVSDWFDFALLDKSVKKNNKIEYRIIGPAKDSMIKEYSSEKLIFTGAIEHSMLSTSIQDCDALIMPFQLNQLILAVDPVKLYEYIQFGKCIISIWYPEIERFEPFVYFYRTSEEYMNIVEYLVNKGFPPKYNEEQRKKFLSENSWEKRYELVKKGIENLVNM